MTGLRGFTDAIPLRAAMVRATVFFAIWIILVGGGSIDLLPGAVAALAATWTSLRLLPTGDDRVHPRALGQLAVRFLCQSVLAGTDVARRALDPRLPLDPGFVHYTVRLPPGPRRNTFTTLMSLLPGTVPIGPDERDALVVHCLDVGHPITAQLAPEEALLARIFGEAPGNG